MAQAPAVRERSAIRSAVPTDPVLRFTTAVFVAGFLVHNADHVRRGVGTVSAQVLGGGVVVSILAVVAVALVVLRHSAAPLVATAVGLTTAVAVTASHLLPHWSAFSDAFPGSHVDGLSWFAVIFEIAGALALAAGGLHAMRRRD